MMIQVGGPEYQISAAHFLATPNFIEPLHGHNYLVAVELDFPRLSNGMAADFRSVRSCLLATIGLFNHKVLLAEQNPCYTLRPNLARQEMEVTFNQPSRPQARRYIFPLEDVLSIPFSDTTTEFLLTMVQDKFNAYWNHHESNVYNSLKTTLEEAPGRAVSAIWQRPCSAMVDAGVAQGHFAWPHGDLVKDELISD